MIQNTQVEQYMGNGALCRYRFELLKLREEGATARYSSPGKLKDMHTELVTHSVFGVFLENEASERRKCGG